jgi:hypothetical protein
MQVGDGDICNTDSLGLGVLLSVDEEGLEVFPAST